MALLDAKPFHASQIKTLAGQVEQEIERQILSGEIEAGNRVNEVMVAKALGVSRGPVREALQGLSHAGLVRIVANKGAVVREIGVAEAIDLYDLRAAVWAAMAERLARVRDREQLAVLRSNIDAMAGAIGARDLEHYYRLNLEFHDNIVAFAGMQRAAAVYRGLVKEMHLFRRRGLLRDVPTLEDSLAEHRILLDAIERGDAPAAFDAARGHVTAGKERFLATIESIGASSPESS